MSKQKFNPAANDIRAGSTDFSFEGLPGAEAYRDNPMASDGNKEAERFSPEALMHKNRIIIVAGEVNAQLTYRTILYIKHLEAMDPEKPITLLINSPGGSVVDGMAIVNTARQCKCPIITVGSGMQASMGSIFLAAGDQRFMQPNAKLMIHQISGGAQGQASDMEIRSGFMTSLHEELKNHYVEYIGLNHKYWDIVMERDTWFSAEQAKAIGFIDGITEAHKPGGRYAEDAKRDKKDDFNKFALEAISKMSAKQVIEALGNGQGEEHTWGRYRPQLAVRLAEFPEFWTKQRRAEAKLEAAKTGASNDDNAKAQPAATKTAKKGTAPKA